MIIIEIVAAPCRTRIHLLHDNTAHGVMQRKSVATGEREKNKNIMRWDYLGSGRSCSIHIPIWRGDPGEYWMERNRDKKNENENARENVLTHAPE